MRTSKYFVRKKLPHATPSWVRDGEIFFITICATHRETQPLVRDDVPERLLAAAIHYHEIGRWWARLFLIMPDHVHGLVAVPRQEVLRKVVATWKSYTAKTCGIMWQQDFFDHRTRDADARALKERYILENPVRRGLTKTSDAWPWVWRASTDHGSSNRQSKTG